MLLNYFLVFLAAFCWSFSFVIQKILIANLSAVSLLFFRCFFSYAMIGGVIAVTKTPVSFSRHHHALFPLVGIVSFAAPFLLISSSVLVLPSNVLGILQATSSLMTLVLAHVLTVDERMTWLKAAAFSMGTIGLLLLFHAQNHELLVAITQTPAEPVFWVMLAVTSYSFGAITSKRFYDIPVLTSTFYSLLWATLSVFPLKLMDYFVYEHPFYVDARTLVASFFMGGVLTAMPFLIRQYVINRAGASFFSLVGFMIPPLSIVNGGLFLGETLSLVTVEALAFILLALYLSKVAFDA